MWNRALGAARLPCVLTILGILFAVAPTVVWVTIARTRSVGFAIGGALLTGAGLLISVQQGWIDAPRPDAHLVFTALVPLLIACGAGLEGRHEDSPPRNGSPAATERSASWGRSSPSPSWSASCTP